MTMRTATDTVYGAAPADENDTFSVIDRNSVFDGTFQTTRNLKVEGEVKGTIECKGTLFVAQGATVGAKVEADNVTVAGDLNGEIRCRGRLQIMPSGKVRGKVNTQTLVINEGALYEGQLEMSPVESGISVSQPKPLPQSDQKPPVAISTAASRAAANDPSGSTFIRRLGGPETPWDGTTDEEPGPEHQEQA
jgi:cytoskeletal protein CcmA (bactofilin family)